MPTQGNWYYQDNIPALCLETHQDSKNLCGDSWYISIDAPLLTLTHLIQFFKEDHKIVHESRPLDAKLLRRAILWVFNIDSIELRKEEFLWSDIP